MASVVLHRSAVRTHLIRILYCLLLTAVYNVAALFGLGWYLPLNVFWISEKPYGFDEVAALRV